MNITYRKDGIELSDKTFISLDYITEMCNNLKIQEKEIVLLEMGWSGRSGEVFEQIALPKESALRIKHIMLNEEVYFGEIWGKHSEVYGQMTDETFEIVEDEIKVKSFLSSYPDGWDYNYSFIDAFRESYQQKIDDEGEDSDDLQNILDELDKLITDK